MCKDKSFKCVDAIFQLNTDDPESFEKWKKMFPCVEMCKELEDLCNALETIMNLEEMDIYYNSEGKIFLSKLKKVS